MLFLILAVGQDFDELGIVLFEESPDFLETDLTRHLPSIEAASPSDSWGLSTGR